MNPIDITPQVVSPPWMGIAWAKLGTREVVGKKHNPIVLEFHKATGLGASTDEVPWCSSFVCWSMQTASMQTTRSAAAKSWLKWGQALDMPRYGCIVVFDRSTALQPGGGHVGFYIDETPQQIVVLGGNQGNTVCTALYARSKLLGYRWPAKLPQAA